MDNNQTDQPVADRSGKRIRKYSLHKLSVSILTLCLVTACAPDLGKMPRLAEPSTLETKSSFAAPQTDWPSKQWWTVYNDPQLDQLISEALHDSPDLKVAEARIRNAEAMSDVQGANLWPTLFADGATQETEASQNQGYPPAYRSMMPRGWHHFAQVKVGFQYEFDFFGKNRAALNAAISETEAAKAEGAEARLQISASVASAYAGLMQLFTEQQIAIEAIRTRRESATLVEKRWKAGLENEAAHSQSQAQTKAAQVEAREIERLITIAQHQIAVLLGKGPDRGLTITATSHQLKSVGLPPRIAVDLIGRRPDIVAARRIVEAAALRIKVAEINFYPNIDLTGNFGLQALDAKYLVQATSETGALGPAIHLPIFDYGQNAGIYRGARADYDNAAAQYDKTLTNALREVADAYANRSALDDELTNTRASLKDIENSYRIISVRYKGGFARYLDVLTAENMLQQQKKSVTDLETQAFTADIALIRSLGGGFVEKH